MLRFFMKDQNCNASAVTDIKCYLRMICQINLAMLHDLVATVFLITFDAYDTVKGCLALFNGMLKTITFHKDIMEQSAKHGFTNATDAADYLVNHGVPFRDAHGIVGRLVLYCIDKGIALDDMSLEEYKAISPVFENDIYEAIDVHTCVDKRNTIGAPGPKAMEQVIAINKKWIEEHEE